MELLSGIFVIAGVLLFSYLSISQSIKLKELVRDNNALELQVKHLKKVLEQTIGFKPNVIDSQ